MSLHKKLLDFHAQFKGAPKTGFNPHFNSQFHTLQDVVGATTPILNKCGLYVAHDVNEVRVDGETTRVLRTTIFTEDGQEMQSHFPLPRVDNPQAIASAITYAKRLNLTCLLNVAEEDDDGRAAVVEMALEGAQTAPEPPKMANKTQWKQIEKFRTDGALSDAQLEWLEEKGELTYEEAGRLIHKVKIKLNKVP